jgi:phage gp29-like protein
MLYDAKGRPISSAKKFIQAATRQTANGEFLSAIDRLPHPSKLLQNIGETIEVFEKIEQQIDVAAAINDYRAGISSMDYTIQSSTEESPRAGWLQDYLDSIDLPGIIEQALEARDYGYGVLEITEWKRFKGKVVPRTIEAKPQKWFGFDQHNALRFYTKENRNEGVEVFKTWPNKFILARHRHRYANPYGKALLDVAYWYAVGLNGNFEFMMTFLEEDGRDKWVVRHPRGATSEEINNALNMAYELRNNGVAAIPEGNEFDKKDVTGRASSSEAYTKADELLSRKILKLWYGTDLMMQVEGKGGYSSSKSGVEIRGEALSSGKRIAQQVIGDLVSIIASINALPGSDDETITFTLTHDEEITQEEASRDNTYMSMPGVRPTKKFFLNRGFQEDEFDYAGEGDPNRQTPQPQGDEGDPAIFGTAHPASATPPVDMLKAYDLLKKKP